MYCQEFSMDLIITLTYFVLLYDCKCGKINNKIKKKKPYLMSQVTQQAINCIQ